jgi:hypothetical protein
MDCKQCLALIEDYREGRLAKPVEAALAEHLGSCRPCKTVMSRLDTMDHRLQIGMAALAPAADFPERVMAAVRRADARTTFRTRRLWIGSAAAAACLILTAAGWWITRANGPRQDLPREVAEEAPRMCVEPAPDLPCPIGPAFVAVKDGPVLYEKATGITVRRIVRGAPELVVDVFPGDPGPHPAESNP